MVPEVGSEDVVMRCYDRIWLMMREDFIRLLSTSRVSGWLACCWARASSGLTLRVLGSWHVVVTEFSGRDVHVICRWRRTTVICSRQDWTFTDNNEVWSSEQDYLGDSWVRTASRRVVDLQVKGVTTRLAPLIATPRLPWDSCNMWTTLARRVAVNSACRLNCVQLVAGSRTLNIIRLYIETLSEHYESWQLQLDFGKSWRSCRSRSLLGLFNFCARYLSQSRSGRLFGFYRISNPAHCRMQTLTAFRLVAYFAPDRTDQLCMLIY